MVTSLLILAGALGVLFLINVYVGRQMVYIVPIDNNHFAMYKRIGRTNKARLLGCYKGHPQGDNVEDLHLTMIWSVSKPTIDIKE